jgi:LmbE family N-acetylglucosaminyl deacetylase
VSAIPSSKRGAPRVLAIGAHPDDVELLCGGTLVLLHEAGWRVHVATMSPGDLGSATLDPVATATLRRDEARRAAAMVKGTYHCVEARDFQVFFGDELVRRTTALLREIDPDLVLTHSPADYLADHEETSRIVRTACFAAPVAHYDAAQDGALDSGDPPRPTSRVASLYYADPVELVDALGEPVAPHFVVDVTSAMAMKELMLTCHASQREWLRAQHGEDDYVATMRRWSATRGRAAGVEFGEGFRHHRGHGFPRAPLLQTALSASVRSL